MANRPAWSCLGERGLSSARSALERYMLNKVGDVAFAAVADPDADARLARRCGALATFLTPQHLDIDPSVVNEVVLELAAAELRRLDVKSGACGSLGARRGVAVPSARVEASLHAARP